MMTKLSMAVFLITCVSGSIVQITTGFGFGIVCMAVFPYILPGFGQSVAISAMSAATISGMVALRYHKFVNFKVIIPLFCGYVVASTLSIKYASAQSQGFMMRLLGVVLIVVSIYFMFFSDKIRMKPTVFNGVLAGTLGGIGAGMFAIGGPPAVLYLMVATKDKDEYRSSTLAYFTIGSLYTTGVRVYEGIITWQTVQLWLLALVALSFGTWVGNRLFNRINAAMLRRLVYGFMIISGVTMLF